MKIHRLNYERDIDEAVNLYNRSFPNNISKDDFLWKHKDNPFGRSYGLVAVEDDKIIGLRMFMKWKFSKGDNIFNAIRPVDTCTDPDSRGKGIFKKLTLEGIKESENKYDFIFNTPNSQSIKGYLKMGWKKIQKPIRYSLGFVNPFSKKVHFNILDKSEFDLDNLIFCNNEISTQLSRDYLKWRYKFSEYKIAKFPDKTFVVFRINKIKGMKVLILLEICGAAKDINAYLNSLALNQGAFVVYYLKDKSLSSTEFPVSLARGKQDVVLKGNGNDKIRNLSFSAGDLEGII